jgi:hypothetical protein
LSAEGSFRFSAVGEIELEVAPGRPLTAEGLAGVEEGAEVPLDARFCGRDVISGGEAGDCTTGGGSTADDANPEMLPCELVSKEGAGRVDLEKC